MQSPAQVRPLVADGEMGAPATRGSRRSERFIACREMTNNSLAIDWTARMSYTAVLIQQRRTSATLQAWAMQPRGV